MHIKASSLDDLLRYVLDILLRSKSRVSPTKGDNREITGAVLELTRPRARLSHSEARGLLFSALGEFLWYLSKGNDVNFIKYYINDYGKYAESDGTVWGAYGPRIFNQRGIDQLQSIRARLAKSRDSRKAVIQLFDAGDLIGDYKDVPCTCTLQFLIRRDHLHMITSMRSNDAYMGLLHDVFAFTMLQELLACELGVGLGRYKHFAGSLHLYDSDIDGAKRYLSEGYQPTTVVMPAMPQANPWSSVSQVLDAEKMLREGIPLDMSQLALDPYWLDIVRLLKIYSLTRDVSASDKQAKLREIVNLKNVMTSDIYDQYIRKRERRFVIPKQETLDLGGAETSQGKTELLK